MYKAKKKKRKTRLGQGHDTTIDFTKSKSWLPLGFSVFLPRE
mgnify:CR=1 FL=1